MKIRRKCLYFIALIFTIITVLTNAELFAACSTGLNNNDLCPPPIPAPQLPSAGGSFLDPTFGTKIIRVTDANDGNANAIVYSYWQQWSLNSTKFWIARGNSGSTVPTLYLFNPSTLTVSRAGALFSDVSLSQDGLIFSGKNNNYLYGYTCCTANSKIYRCDTTNGVPCSVANGRMTLIKDMKTLLNPGEYIYQISMSENDDVFGFTIKKYEAGQYTDVGVGYYKVSTKTFKRYDVTNLNECQIDKSGRYLTIVKDDPYGMVIWDIQAETKTDIPWDQTNRPVGHYDQDYGILLGASAWGDFNKRDLPNSNITTIFIPKTDNVDWHVSKRNNTGNWFCASNLAMDNLTNNPKENEILLVYMNGNGWHRLAHHRNYYIDYGSYPRALIDRNGKFILFNSNWNNFGQRDVFILVIPDAIQSKDISPLHLLQN